MTQEQRVFGFAEDKGGKFIVMECPNECEIESVVIAGNIFDFKQAKFLVNAGNTHNPLINLLKQADALLGVDCKGQSACENIAELKSDIAQLIKSVEA